jgi:hypothetical protein
MYRLSFEDGGIEGLGVALRFAQKQRDGCEHDFQ